MATTKVSVGVIADGAVTAAKLGSSAVETAKIDDGAVTAAKLGASAVETAKIDDEAVTAGKLAATLNLSAKTLTLPAANTPVFTKSYTSANQTVTAAGTLALAHSLGGMPALVQCRLKCVTAELGYSIGDEVIVNPGPAYVSSSTGLSVVPDATNVTIRFGSSGGGISVVRKDTGALAIITAANWNLIVKAWA